MTCKTCKYYVFHQNDMLGLCKLYPTVVNKSPTDWCGQEIPARYEAVENKSITISVEPKSYDINTDEFLPVNQENQEKTGKRKYARKQK